MLSIFLVLLTSIAFAESPDPQQPHMRSQAAATQTDHEIKFEYRDNLGSEDVTKMRSRLLMVDEALAPYFGPAPNLVVIAYKDSLVPLFGSRWVKLPVEYKAKRKLPDGKIEITNLKSPEPLWIHEYSHAYFERALNKTLNEWIKRNNVDIDKLSEVQRTFLDDVHKISRPFNELFADTVAAVLLNDGKIFSDFEKISGGSDEEAKARDFTVPHTMENLPHPDAADGWYFLLGAPRSQIWVQYQKNMKEQGFSKGKFIRQVYDAIDAEIMQVASEMKGLSKDSKQLNLDFIKRIEGKITGK
jgi:hypothetical protein